GGVAQPGAQDGVEGLLQVAMRDPAMPVARERHLALLGDPYSSLHAAPGLAQDRAVGRPAAPADRAPAPMEEQQADAFRAADVGQLALRAIELPVRRDEPAVLVAVGIAEHHLLQAAPGLQVAAI